MFRPVSTQAKMRQTAHFSSAASNSYILRTAARVKTSCKRRVGLAIGLISAGALAALYSAVLPADASDPGVPVTSVTSIPASINQNQSASGFSSTSCSAKGTTASRVFLPSGAVRNGAADSTIAIQNAIDNAAAAGGGVVKLPSGTFTLDGHLVMKDNVRITGSGPGTVLKAGPGFLGTSGPDGGYPVVTTAGASDVSITDLTADQSGDILNGNANPQGRLTAYLIDVRDSHNVVVKNVGTRNPFTYSIAVVGSSDFCIRHCSTEVTSSGRYDQLDGIHILDSNTGQVIQNNVDQRIGSDGDDGLVAHTISAPVDDILYANNTVRGGNNGDGMQLAVGDYPIYDITIRNNEFYGSPYGIRTGYYNSGSNSAVHNIIISGNYIHDLVPGKAFPLGGNAINIGGFGTVVPVTHITVSGNRTCNAGAIAVVKGTANRVAGNALCIPAPAPGASGQASIH